MNTDARVSELLLEWEERCEQGRPIPVEDLCRDCPQLLDELRRRVRALQAMNPLLQSPPAATPPGRTLEFAAANFVATADPEGSPPRAAPKRFPAVPGYEILRELGRGGMGVVYLARHLSLNRMVAVKMLLADAYTTEQQRRRFRGEAEAVARLQHPNIVQVYEVGEVDGLAYCALEYIDGGNLAEALDGKPCAPRQAAELLAVLANAVQAAHARGVIHRDLKPANILLQKNLNHPDTEPQRRQEKKKADTEKKDRFASAPRPGMALDGSPAQEQNDRKETSSSSLRGASGSGWFNSLAKITDFGLAKRLEESSHLTATGTVMGTPSYMAPEQAAGHNDKVGPAADLYSLGAMLYELLTGRPPLLGASAVETLQMVLCKDPVPPRSLQPNVPRDLETICLKCLHKAPARRYASARELAGDLRRFLAGDPIHARPVGAAERLVRWCRKHPAVTALTAAVFLLLAAVAATASVGYVHTTRALASEERQHREAERLRTAAEEQREVAVAAEQKANAEATRSRRLLYAGDMQLAAQMWESEYGAAHRVDELLAAWRPKPGEEDLRDFAWRYLWGLLYDAPSILPGRHGVVRRGAWRSDGKLVTIDSQFELRCLDPASGKVLARASLKQPDEFTRYALAADGSVVAVLTNKKSLRLIDPATGETRRTLPNPGAGRMRLTPDGQRLLVCGGDGVVGLWDTSSGKLVRKLPMNPGVLAQMAALAPDGLTLAIRTGSARSQAALLDLPKRIPPRRMPAAFTLYSLIFSPDGKKLAGGTFGGMVYVWDVESTRQENHLSVHVGSVVQLGFSHDGKRLASGSAEGVVLLTALEDDGDGKRILRDGKTLFRGKGHLKKITFLSLSPDGKKLASGSEDGTIRIWDVTKPPGPPVIQEARGRIMQLIVSPDGKWLASVQGPAIRLYDARTVQLVKTLTVPGADLRRVAFRPDSKGLAAGDGAGVISLWDIETGKQVGALREKTGLPINKKNAWGVSALTFSPDGALLVAGHGNLRGVTSDYDQVVRVWDVRSGKILRLLPHRNTVYSLAFSPDGAVLASGCDAKVRTWNVADWQPGRTWTISSRIASMALSPGGDRIAAGSMDGGVYVWEVGSGKLALELNEHVRRVDALAFTPDGKILVSGGEDHTVRLWHLASGRSLLGLHGHPEHVWAVAVTHDGNLIVSGDQDGGVRLWRAPSFARIEAVEAASKR